MRTIGFRPSSPFKASRRWLQFGWILWSCLCAGLAYGSCPGADPDSRKVEFSEAVGAPGVYISGYYGKDSYRAYLHGPYQAADIPPEMTGAVMFMIDGILMQQLVAERIHYSKKKRLSDDANLQAHAQWEMAHALKYGAKPTVQNFGVVENTGIDGDTRKFHIWAAQSNGATQYYVSTSASFGVISLSLLGVKPEQEAQAKEIIDNYMYRFRTLRPDEC